MSLKETYSNSLKSYFKSDAKGLEGLILKSCLTVMDLSEGMNTIFYGKPLTSASFAKNTSRPKNPLDLGIIPILDKIVSVNYCDIVNYAVSNIPAASSFDPNKKPTDTFGLVKWNFQNTAFTVQTEIDKYYRNYTDPNNPESKNALLNLVNDVKHNFSTFTNKIKKEIDSQSSTTPQIPGDIATLANIATPEQSIDLLITTFPVLKKVGSYVNDKISSYEKFTDYRQIPSSDLQKIINSVDKIREYCVLIQALNTPASVTAALGALGVGNALNESIKRIQDIINPAQAIPTLKKIVNACVKIQRICTNISTIIRFGQLIITLATTLVKVFKAIITFFKVSPIPNLYTTSGITTTFSTITEKLEKQGVNGFITRLNQVNILLGLIVNLLNTLIPILNDVIAKLNLLIANLQACNSLNTLDETGIINQLQKVSSDLKSTVDSFNKFLENKQTNDKVKSRNNQFGEYTISIIEEEVVDETFTLRRRYGVALDNRGIKILQSTPTFASDDNIIIQEVKQLLSAKNLVKAKINVYSLEEEDAINESTAYLYDDSTNWDNIEVGGYSLDSPNSNTESDDNLGLNAFLNSIKGSNRLRRRMRKMMEKNKNNLQSNLSSTDPSGRLSNNIAGRV
jgi:hypothetical protein